MNFFSKNLKFLREKKKLNQQEIADNLNIPRTTYTCWENGIRTPKIEQILDIANYFNVGMDIISRDYSIEKNSFSNRLNEAIELNNITPLEFANKVDTDESIIDSCLQGKYRPNSMNLQRFAAALNVSDKWLKGEDVDINGNSNQDEIEILYHKHKDKLTDSDKTIIKTVIEQRIKEENK